MVMMMGAGLPLGGTDSAGEQYSRCRPVTRTIDPAGEQQCTWIEGGPCGGDAGRPVLPLLMMVGWLFLD
jgi:hypothetical protein